MSSSYLLRDRTQLLIDFLDRGDKQHLSRGQSPESFRTTGRQTDRQRNAQPKPTKCKSSGLRTPQSEDTSIIADREQGQAVARLLPDPRPMQTHGLRRHRPDERQLLGDVFPVAWAVLRDVIPASFVCVGVKSAHSDCLIRDRRYRYCQALGVLPLPVTSSQRPCRCARAGQAGGGGEGSCGVPASF